MKPKKYFSIEDLFDGIYDGDKWREACIVISKWLEQEPKEITLEDVKGYCKQRSLTIITNELYHELTHSKIKALEQEPKIGHWIATYGNVKCSICGRVKDSRDVGKATHYCDRCGAKMVEPQESEET